MDVTEYIHMFTYRSKKSSWRLPKCKKNKRGFIIVLLKPMIVIMLQAAVCPSFIFSLVKVKACRTVITV